MSSCNRLLALSDMLLPISIGCQEVGTGTAAEKNNVRLRKVKLVEVKLT